MSTSTFIAIERGRTHFGIHAPIVRTIVQARDWKGAEPFDIAAALGISPTDSEHGHPVLLVGMESDPEPMRAFGTVVLRQLDVARICLIPQFVWDPARLRAVSGVAFDDATAPLLVLDPLALLSLAKEAART